MPNPVNQKTLISRNVMYCQGDSGLDQLEVLDEFQLVNLITPCSERYSIARKDLSVKIATYDKAKRVILYHKDKVLLDSNNISHFWNNQGILDTVYNEMLTYISI